MARLMAMLATVAALALPLAGCSDSTPNGPPSSLAVSAPAVQLNSADVDAYIAELEAIDPLLAVDPEATVRRTQEICAKIRQGDPEDAVIDGVVERLSADGAELTANDAKKIVDVAERYICG